MIKKYAITCVITFFCLSGCQEDKTKILTAKTDRIDTPAGMIKYLKSQNLPAMKSVQVWENQYGPGLKITTAHYDIFTTLLEPLMLSQVPGFIESAYQGYQNQLPRPVTTATRFTIYLFAERLQWEDFTKNFAGSAAPMYCRIKAGAYYLNGACVVYNIGRERTFSVLGHEGWHQFNSRHFKYRLPSWLDEGIAMLFEANRYEKGLFYFEPALNTSRLGALKAMLIKDKMIPLRSLIALNPGEVLVSDETEAVTAFYSQSYALVRFLREASYSKWLQNYHQLLMDGLKGNWSLSETHKTIAADRNIPLTVRWNRAVGTQLFEQYVDNDFDQIEKEYITFCRKIVYHVHFK